MTEFNQKPKWTVTKAQSQSKILWVLIFFPFLMAVTNITSRWWSWGGSVADIWGPRKFSDGASNHLIFWHKLGNFFVLFRWFLWIFHYFTKEEDLLCHTLHCPLIAIKKLASVLHFVLVVCAHHQKLSFHTFDQNCRKFAKTVSDNTKQIFFRAPVLPPNWCLSKVWICFGVLLKWLRSDKCRRECQRPDFSEIIQKHPPIRGLVWTGKNN